MICFHGRYHRFNVFFQEEIVMRGERLAELRKDAGLTQRQFAQQLHVSLNTVSSWERNLADPDDATKIQLARQFGVSLDYLMGLTDTPHPQSGNISVLLCVQNMPTAALEELNRFLVQLKKKYGI